MINIVNIQFCIGIYRAIFRPLLGPKENIQILKTKMKKNKTKQNPPECIVDIVLSFETRQRRIFRGVVYLLLVVKMVLINPNESLFTYVNHRQKPMVIHACAYWLLVTSHYHEGNLTNCVFHMHTSINCMFLLHDLCVHISKKKPKVYP